MSVDEFEAVESYDPSVELVAFVAITFAMAAFAAAALLLFAVLAAGDPVLVSVAVFGAASWVLCDSSAADGVSLLLSSSSSCLASLPPPPRIAFQSRKPFFRSCILADEKYL